MRFSQSAYSQDENMSPFSVRLVLDPFGGSGSGTAATTQDIVEQITAFAQMGDTATGREIMSYILGWAYTLCNVCWDYVYVQIKSLLSQQMEIWKLVETSLVLHV